MTNNIFLSSCVLKIRLWISNSDFFGQSKTFLKTPLQFIGCVNCVVTLDHWLVCPCQKPSNFGVRWLLYAEYSAMFGVFARGFCPAF